MDYPHAHSEPLWIVDNRNVIQRVSTRFPQSTRKPTYQLTVIHTSTQTVHNPTTCYPTARRYTTAMLTSRLQWWITKHGEMAHRVINLSTNHHHTHSFFFFFINTIYSTFKCCISLWNCFSGFFIYLLNLNLCCCSVIYKGMGKCCLCSCFRLGHPP